jgi:hypothetical protein
MDLCGEALYASDATAAVKMLRDNSVDLVLLDLADDVKMEMLTTIREYDKIVPAIVLSVSESAGAVEQDEIDAVVAQHLYRCGCVRRVQRFAAEVHLRDNGSDPFGDKRVVPDDEDRERPRLLVSVLRHHRGHDARRSALMRASA